MKKEEEMGSMCWLYYSSLPLSPSTYTASLLDLLNLDSTYLISKQLSSRDASIRVQVFVLSSHDLFLRAPFLAPLHMSSDSYPYQCSLAVSLFFLLLISNALLLPATSRSVPLFPAYSSFPRSLITLITSSLSHLPSSHNTN